MSKDQRVRSSVGRRQVLRGATVAAAATIFAPAIVRSQSKMVRIGMPTILSGRVAQLGTSSRNAVELEVARINAAGGLAGRQIEMVIRDSKAQPQEAARVVRELVNTDGCEIIIDAEASTASFAVQEVAKDLGFLVIHTNSETSSLTADPKIRIPNAFRTARQGIHDAVVGGQYAAGVVKAKGLKRWMSCSPDYAYGRDTTTQFLEYLKRFAPEVEVIGESWPKIFQPDYTEVITRILQSKPQALYSCLWGGDLTSFIDQAAIYALFSNTSFFAVNMADYTALTTIKNLPEGIHSGNRYIKTFPATPANAKWADEYRAKYKEYPTNWSWQNAATIHLLAAAAKKAESSDGKKLVETLRGLTIDSPFGAEGKLTLREEDGTLINYAVGWGVTIPKEPYVPSVSAGNWKTILELEAEWKKRNYA